MESRRVFAFVAFAFCAVAGIGGTNACTSKSCTLVACESGAAITTHPALGSFTELVGATLGVCMNGNCSSGVLGVLADGGPGNPNASSVALNGDLGLQNAQIGSDGNGVTVTFGVGENDSPKSKIHTTGDTFRVTITGADKSTIVDATRTLTYPQTSQPNGPDCGPTCHNATVDIAP